VVIGLVAKKLFIERMVARRNEEYEGVHKSMSPFSQDESEETKLPMIWLVIDEAHEFLPREGKTLASDPLITILREGRQPGISLILATTSSRANTHRCHDAG
jgi:DNA helicase HerA-like ATPase